MNTVNATAETDSGGNVFLGCLPHYSSEIEANASKVAADIGREIGRSMCTFVEPYSIYISTVGVSMSARQNQVQLLSVKFISFSLQ